MDGVIVDSEPVHFEAEKESFAKLGISVLKEEHESYVGMDQRGIWENIKINYMIDLPVEEMIKNHIKTLEEYITKSELMTMGNLVEFIEKIKKNNIKCAVASSSPKNLINLILKRIGIYNKFDLIISGEEVANGKPAPDIFLKTAEMLSVKNEESVVIEDSENGIKAAKLSNMRCIGFDNPNSGEQNLKNADIVVKGFGEIINIF